MTFAQWLKFGKWCEEEIGGYKATIKWSPEVELISIKVENKFIVKRERPEWICSQYRKSRQIFILVNPEKKEGNSQYEKIKTQGRK